MVCDLSAAKVRSTYLFDIMSFLETPETPFNFLSLGAGVQSSALALMAAHGEVVPVPTAAIFADVGAEPESVYRWLDELERLIQEAPNPFPVIRVKHGNLERDALQVRTSKSGKKYFKVSIPFFTEDEIGNSGPTPRQCTQDYKINPIRKEMRKLAGIKRGQKEITATSWIGISLDEIERMKDSRDLWCVHRWPLIEKRMTRLECLAWMQRRGYPMPPRSACYFCPYHSNSEWLRMEREEPHELEKAQEWERRLIKKAEDVELRGGAFLHRKMQPLGTRPFSANEGQGTFDFRSECFGMCGV